MPFRFEDLCSSPNALAEHYRHFRVSERLLLTGHSHQAWPDCAFDGQRRAFEDAARFVDEKWVHAFEAAERARDGYRRLLDDPTGLYSLAASTHDLVVKLLSALPWGERSKVVTTDSEFYSLARQLRRLEEEGVEVVRLAARPAVTIGDRLAAEVDDRTAAVFTSTVFFSSAHIAGDLTLLAETCRRHGVPLILDTYHQLNVVPFSLRRRQLEDVYVVSAGYKYCQLGEGNAILRFPENCTLRPVATGWFAEFDTLTLRRASTRVTYSSRHQRFAGATYDPTSHYRAAEVFRFFREQELSPELLRRVSQHQVGLLIELFDELDMDPTVIDRDRSVPLEELGGFLVLRSPLAGRLHGLLKRAGVYTDVRDQALRLGPAPYLCDTQLEEAMEILGGILRGLPTTSAKSHH
jgi:kynureninase